jgi:hypothetical protein
MIVTAEQIEWAVESARANRSTWLEQLVALGLVDEERVCATISAQACVSRTDPRTLPHLPIDLVARLPAEVAIEHRVIPLGIEADGDLRVAMVDPLDSHAVEEVQFFAGRPVIREVIAASALAWALHYYHGVHSVLWPRSVTKTQTTLVEDNPRVSQLG